MAVCRWCRRSGALGIRIFNRNIVWGFECGAKKKAVSQSPAQAFQVAEFFAGDGNVGKTAKYGMVACAQLDVDYGKKTTRIHKQNAFDLLQPSGLALRGFVLIFFMCVFF